MKNRLGIVGGGQLARMMVLAAKPLGYHVTVIDPMPGSPAGQVADEQIVAAHDDPAATRELGSRVDFVTVELEWADAAALEELAAAGVPVNPSAATLGIIKDKLAQKRFLSEHGLPVAAFEEVATRADIARAGEKFGYPVVLKARFGAYDGRGNAVIRSVGEIEAAMDKLAGRDLYVEQWVPFVKELAVVTARGMDGAIVTYPVVETFHQDNILHIAKMPAPAPYEVRAAAETLATQTMRELGGAGVYGIEMFLTGDGRVLINEIAPRVHNSGHQTIEGSRTSQFEQHVRAVTGLPLGSTEMAAPAVVMVNILGDEAGEVDVGGLPEALADPGVAVHIYGKAEARPARKLGHVTAVGQNMDEALERAMRARERIKMTGEKMMNKQPLVGIIMGSDSDLPVMSEAAKVCEEFGVPCEVTIVSAHRTPERMVEYAQAAEGRGLRVIIAGAAYAAHLPGMTASLTPLPVIGVPVQGRRMEGLDSLLSIAQMPPGIPVATMAIQGAQNAGLMAVRILAAGDDALRAKVRASQAKLRETIEAKAEKLESQGYAQYLKGM